MGKRIYATLIQEALYVGKIIELGRTSVDVTDMILNMKITRLHRLRDRSTLLADLISGLVSGSKWPYTVFVVDQICGFFGVDSLTDITMEMIMTARSSTQARKTIIWVVGCKRRA